MKSVFFTFILSTFYKEQLTIFLSLHLIVDILDTFQNATCLDSVLNFKKVRHNNYNKLTMLIWTVVTEIAHLKSFHGRKKSFQPFNCETDKWLFCTKSLGNKFLLISEDRKVFVWKNDEIKRMPVTNKLLCTTINNHFHQTC